MASIQIEQCNRECKKKLNSKYFSTQYNELLGFYLANNDASSSIFILFLQDEIYMEKDCSKYEASRVLEKGFRLKVL